MKKSKLERLERKNEDITDGCTNRYMYMYRQSSTEKPGLTSTKTTMKTVAQNLRSRWVINMSEKPLMEAQENLLAHGPNFANCSQKSIYRRVHCSSRTNLPKNGPWGA